MLLSTVAVICSAQAIFATPPTPHKPPPFPFNAGFDVRKIAALAKSIPSHSWEYGTAAQTLLELYDPAVSVFGSHPFPVPTLRKEDVESLEYAAQSIVIGTGVNSLADGDGATGDPASLGVSAILLGKTNATYAKAVDRTVEYLMTSAPRTYNGAISHRADYPELWADYIYMAPPTTAYYAADVGDEELLRDTVKQIGLYRDILRANLSSSVPYEGIWHHIIGPRNRDLGLWSTGNAWAAAGITRVLATVMKAPHPTNTARTDWRHHGIAQLKEWVKEILDGAMGAPKDDGLLRNYLNDTISARGFGEVSGSTLLAAVAYRVAVLAPHAFGPKYVHWADEIMTVIGGKDAKGEPHVTSNGTVTPAVNPLNWYDTKPFTSGSPEGQNFVVLMYVAWRDCVWARICSEDGGVLHA